MNDHGFVVCAYNRTVAKVERFLANEAKGTSPLTQHTHTHTHTHTHNTTHTHTGTKVIGGTSLEDMVSKLKKPRRVMMLVKAGKAVDDFIDLLVPLLEAGDIIIDGGNSEYTDSNVSILCVTVCTTCSPPPVCSVGVSL